jgi:hypothetical protein
MVFDLAVCRSRDKRKKNNQTQLERFQKNCGRSAAFTPLQRGLANPR